MQWHFDEVFIVFKAWETDPAVCSIDFLEKLPDLEVDEHILTKQQLSLYSGLSKFPGLVLTFLCFPVFY